MSDKFTAYGDTTGYVNVDTSRDRAIAEADSGTVSYRARAILDILRLHPDGLTWKELSDILDMHHGQVSGALSNLHRLGHVFMLTAKRNRSHPYCADKYRNWYDDHERIDKPTRTTASLLREAEVAVITAAIEVAESQLFPDPLLVEAVRRLREVRGKQ